MDPKREETPTTAHTSRRSGHSADFKTGANPPQIAASLERTNDGIVAFDSHMNYTYVYKRASELLGRRPEELIGKYYWGEYPEAKGTPFANAYVRALETQAPIVFEEYYAPWDRWFENRIYPSRDGLTIFFTETTERKRAEQALRESEDKFKYVFEAASVGKSITLSTGKASTNQAFADLLGYGREELTDKTWQALTPPEDIESIQAILAPLLTGEKESARFTKRYVHKSGAIVWADVGTVMRRGADGRPLYFITTIIDITERKRAEEILRLSEQRFSNAFHTSPAGMTITRIADGKFIDAHESFFANVWILS